MAWIKDVLLAKPSWSPDCKYQIYLRGLEPKHPNRWYRKDDSGGFYDECFFMSFPHHEWQFFDEIEDAELKLQLLNGA